MKNLRQFVFAAFVTLFVASSTAALFAEADPPSRVARLKYISGQVSMQPGGVNDWAEASVNRPMTTADRLWTDKESRAELRLGNAAMRMNSETSLTLTNLSDNAVQLELDQGTLNLDVTRLYGGEIYEIDTPNMAFTLTRPGAYRFDVDSQSDTTLVTVWNGKGIATGNGEAVKIDSHRQVRFSDGMSLMHATYGAPHQDGFDQWCQVRASRETNIVSARYVSPDVVGYEDLDGYGTWREYPTYGRVWVPVVAAGWAPYSVGHWVWIAPWGWTWVDDAPWGFAPFHYGRWVHLGVAWAWAPGPAYVRPVYAPALVAWVGSSGAGIGWFPLGYGEPYIPSYHVSRGYFETVNVSNTRITNITYVTNTYYNVTNVHITNIHYVNQSYGTTVVNNEVIVNSRPVNHTVFLGHNEDWRNHHDAWVTAGPACAPSHESVLGVHAGERARIPERINQRPVVVKMTPPPRQEPFEPRRGDNGRPWNNDDHRADGHTPNPQHGDNDASNRGYGHDNDSGHGRNGNDDGRREPVADHGRDFPHPGRDRDDDHGQQNANNGHDQNGQEENAHNGNYGNNDDNRRRGRPDWAGVPHEGSSDSPRYPRPPRSSHGEDSQPSSSGNNQAANGQQNGNGDQNQNARNGNGNDNGNNGRRGQPDWAGVPHEGASGSHGPSSSNHDGSQSGSADNSQPGNSGQRNGNGDQDQNAHNGNGSDNGNNGRRGRPDWAGVPHEGASGSPNYPRPSSPASPSNDDHSQPSSASNNQPNQGQSSQASDDRGNHGRGNGNGQGGNNGQGQNANNSNSNGNSGNGGQPGENPAWNRPNQDGNWGNRQVPRPPAQPANNGQGNGMSSGMEHPSQPAYQPPAASQQQAERDVPRPREGVTNRPQPVMQQPQANNQRDYPMPQRQMRQPSYSTQSAPVQQQAQRPVQADRGNSRPAPAAQRASQPQSRPTPSSGSTGNGNSHASGFQVRDQGKVQDR